MMVAQAMDVVLPGWLSYWTLATFCAPPGTSAGFYLGIFSGTLTANIFIEILAHRPDRSGCCSARSLGRFSLAPVQRCLEGKPR